MGIDSFKTDVKNSRNKRWTKQEIKGGINKLAEEKGETPTLRQAVQCDYLPSNGTINSKFGTWNNALDKSGFDVNEKHGHKFDEKHDSRHEDEKVSVFTEVEQDNSFELVEEHSNKSKGEASEALITGKLLKRNVNVLEPYGENQRYDIVIDVCGELFKLQCKTGRLNEQESGVKFSAQSSSIRSDGYVKEPYGEGIDYFAIYVWEMDETFIVHQSEVANSTGTLRLTKTENNQVKGVTFAAEHHIDTVVNKMKQGTFGRQ